MRPPLISNEEECLAAAHRRLTDVMRGMRQTYELVFVNDGSTDGTASLLEGICAGDPH